MPNFFRIEKTSKDFTVIVIPHVEFEKRGGSSKCPLCSRHLDDEVYIVCVLFQELCPHCFHEWHDTAVNYPEDKAFVQRILEEYVEDFTTFHYRR